MNYRAEHPRVGQVTNFDKLILEVWTNGTISGVDAVSLSADILRDELVIFSQLGKPEPPVVVRVHRLGDWLQLGRRGRCGADGGWPEQGLEIWGHRGRRGVRGVQDQG